VLAIAKILVGGGILIALISFFSVPLFGQTKIAEIGFDTGFVIAAIGVLIGWVVTFRAYRNSKNKDD